MDSLLTLQDPQRAYRHILYPLWKRSYKLCSEYLKPPGIPRAQGYDYDTHYFGFVLHCFEYLEDLEKSQRLSENYDPQSWLVTFFLAGLRLDTNEQKTPAWRFFVTKSMSLRG